MFHFSVPAQPGNPKLSIFHQPPLIPHATIYSFIRLRGIRFLLLDLELAATVSSFSLAHIFQPIPGDECSCEFNLQPKAIGPKFVDKQLMSTTRLGGRALHV